MNSDKVERYIREKLEEARKYYPRKIFKGLSVSVYPQSFGSITVRIASDWGYCSGYVPNYNAIDEKIGDFLHRASFNLYENYYNKHHKNGGRG